MKRTVRITVLAACVCSLAIGLTSARVAALATIQVNSTAMAVNAGDGLCTLPEAIRAANTDAPSGGVAGECATGSLGLDIIKMPAGTYTFTAVHNFYAGVPNALPVIVSPIEIIGDGAAATIIERSSAAGTPDIVLFYVEFTGLPADRTGSLTVNGVTLRNGRSPFTRGGAITAASALTTIVDSAFTGNFADWGGAVYQPQGRVIVQRSTFEGNIARRNYGAIYAARGLTVEHSVFRSNVASAGAGGAFGIGPANVADIFDSVFIRNQSPLGVGGAAAAGGRETDPTRLNVTRSWFHENKAVDGGAIVAYRLTMNATTVSDNVATGSGGGVAIQQTGGALGTIADSTFTGNKARLGGAIAGDLNLTNVTISANQAEEAGGGVWVNGHFTGNNITITNNVLTKTHSTFGGGAYFVGSQSIYLANSVIAGNVSGANGRAPDCFSGLAISSLGHNLIGNTCDCPVAAATGDVLGTWDAPIDARLGPLQTNGGFSQTHLPLDAGPLVDTASALTPGSDPAACAVADQRGIARPVDGDANGEARSDRGAVEVDGNPFPARPVFATASYSVDEPGGAATITVRRDDPTGEVEVAFTALAGSATSATDFANAAGNLLFLDGEAEKTFTVSIQDDIILEGTESIRLALRAPEAATDSVPYSSAILFITDDEMIPIPTADDASVVEENGGTKTVAVTIRLTRPYPTSVSVAYATVDGEALAGSDYDGAAGSVVFSPGQTSTTISLAVRGDETYEPNERFTLRLRATVGCMSEMRTATVTILNDDPPPNHPPVLEQPAAQTTEEGQAFSLAPIASDPDNDPLTFSAVGLPAGLAIDPSTGAITGTIAAGAAGSHSVTITVSDGRGGSDSRTFQWTVNDPNHRPSCQSASPSISIIWPPNHRLLVPVSIAVPDPDGDSVTVIVTRILQDEPTDTTGDGATAIDADGVGTSTARVRAERSGSARVPGNGRFYEIEFLATDAHAASCTGSVLVAVPHDRSKPPADDRVRYDSTVPGGAAVR